MRDSFLAAPFPWFGGKSRAASLIWSRLGTNLRNYVEPFFGSGAVLLGRPLPFTGSETVNDIDGLVANAWRSIQHSPAKTVRWATNPVNECDLHARHVWILEAVSDLPARLEADPDYHDPRIAGYWLYGVACWIGSGFASGRGPWRVIHNQLMDTRHLRWRWLGLSAPSSGEKQGVTRKLPHLGNAGQGVTRQLPHLGNAGRGVTRQLPHLGSCFADLAERLLRVRVCCGDWSRVCTPSVTCRHGLTGVVLDPPYADTASRTRGLYRCDSETVAHDVCEWAIEQGARPDMRIALCGYEGEHEMPSDWECVAWKAKGGYASQRASENVNSRRERIWFSPACLTPGGVS